MEEQGGLNLYAFCVNNPINKWDLLGNSWASVYDEGIGVMYRNVEDDYAPPSGPQGACDLYFGSLNSLDNLFAGFDAREASQRAQSVAEATQYVQGMQANQPTLDFSTEFHSQAEIDTAINLNPVAPADFVVAHDPQPNVSVGAFASSGKLTSIDSGPSLGPINTATTDPQRFTVTVNYRPADIPGGRALNAIGIDHQWISTNTGVSVGMGTAQGVPQSDRPGVPTFVVDHTGQVPTSTVTYTNVDQGTLTTYTQIGTPLGAWMPGINDCNTWVRNVMSQSTPHDVVTYTYTPYIGYQSTRNTNVVVRADGSIHQPGEP
jgi:hypothetical protein